jgi:hypothetical protein
VAEGEDTRFLALRHAGQDATDFSLADGDVRRFIALRDEGADDARIADELGRPPEVVAALVRADEAQALAHRIAVGEEPMYPPPEPNQRVAEARLGSSAIPAGVLILVLLGVILYLLVR